MSIQEKRGRNFKEGIPGYILVYEYSLKRGEDGFLGIVITHQSLFQIILLRCPELLKT
jgi:hypothetical protein